MTLVLLLAPAEAVVRRGELALSSTSTLALSGRTVRPGALALASTSTLALTGRTVRLGAITFASTSTVTATATPADGSTVVSRPSTGTVARPVREAAP